MLQAENIRSACCSRVVLSNCSLLAKQIFYFCSCSQKNRRHARECSQRPFVTQSLMITCDELLRTSAWEATGPWVRGVRKNWLLLHVSPTYNVLRHMYMVFPDDVAKGKRFSWCYSSCSYCSCCGSCGCVAPVVV